jgi:hypothetical protein
VACADVFFRQGLRLSDFEFNLRGQRREIWHDHQLVSKVPQAARSLIYHCCLVTETHFSIVSRMISNIPSQIQKEIEFIRPMVEERFAKMKEYGDDWDDKPVCQTTLSVPLSLAGWFTERYGHVADE